MTEPNTDDRSATAVDGAPVGRGPLGADLLALGIAALVIQLAFWERIDLSAHVVAGGGAALVVAAFVPVRRAGAAAPIAALLVLAGAVANEVFAGGVVDLGDVAYTVVGALFVGRSTAWVAGRGHRERGLAIAVGLLAVGLGLGLRYAR